MSEHKHNEVHTEAPIVTTETRDWVIVIGKDKEGKIFTDAFRPDDEKLKAGIEAGTFVESHRNTVSIPVPGNISGLVTIFNTPDSLANALKNAPFAKYNTKVKNKLTEFETDAEGNISFAIPASEEVVDSNSPNEAGYSWYTEPAKRQFLTEREKFIRNMKALGVSDKKLEKLLANYDASDDE